MDSVAFNFVNAEYDIIKESRGILYLNIYRSIKRSPYPNMKQPVPFGGMLGLQVIAEFKIEGLKAANIPFVLYEKDEIVQSGRTNEEGYIYDLLIKLPYFGYNDYSIVFELEDDDDRFEELLG